MKPARTRPNLRIVVASPREYVISERRQELADFPEEYTAVDRVSSLVSDEMIAKDREEIQQAFKVLP